MQQPPNQFPPQYQQPYPQWPQQQQYPPQSYYPPQAPYYPQQSQPQLYYPQRYDYPPPAPHYILTNQVVNVTNTGTQQYGCLIRALYFLFIGWWLGFTWAIIAGVFCATIIGLPIGLTMFHFLPAVLTLQQ